MLNVLFIACCLVLLHLYMFFLYWNDLYANSCSNSIVGQLLSVAEFVLPLHLSVLGLHWERECELADIGNENVSLLKLLHRVVIGEPCICMFLCRTALEVVVLMIPLHCYHHRPP